MKVLHVWKVPAQNTQTFITEMRKKGNRQDGYATLLNHFAGFNFFYETDEKTFGDVSEFAAQRISESHNVEIKQYSIHGN